MSNPVRDELEKKYTRFIELEEQMSDPVVLADGSRMASIAREHGSLSRVALKYRRFKKLCSEINQARATLEQIDDEEERQMFDEEVTKLRADRESLWDELLEETVGGEDAHRSRRLRACVWGEAAEARDPEGDRERAGPTDPGGQGARRADGGGGL